MSVINNENSDGPALSHMRLTVIKQEVEDNDTNGSIDFEDNQFNIEKIKQEIGSNIFEEDPNDDFDILNQQKFPFLASILRPKKVPLKHHEAQFEECNICGKTVKYLEKHLGTHEGHTPEECTICGKKVKHLAKHMEIHEDSIAAVKCTICSKKVKYLERHMEMHEDKRFACTYCRRVFSRKCYIQNHLRDKHRGMPLEFMEVDQSFVEQRRQEELNDPLRVAKCTCAYCGTICKTSKGLRNHLWMKHKQLTALSEKRASSFKTEKQVKQEIIEDPDINSNFKCSYCGVLCKLSQSLMNHLMTKHNKTIDDNIAHAEKLATVGKADPEEIHQCTECGIVCKTAKTLSNHYQYKHKNDKYICDHCGKVFACKPYLKLHIRLMHQPVKLIKCPKCDELFKRKSSLSRHMKTHIPKSERKDKQFPCEHCAESFTTKRDLFEHIKITHKALNCFMCDEVFFNKVDFGKHVITHSEYSKQVELRPYACDVCGKRFQIEAYCKSHRALQHTSDGNANKCVDCGKEFLNAVLLKKHRRNHARKYKCHICNVTCLRKAKLDKHIAIHMVDTPFKCKFCSSSFQARVALHSHLRWHASQKSKQNSAVNAENNDSSEADDPVDQSVQDASSNLALARNMIQHEIFSNLSNSNSSSSLQMELVEGADTTPLQITPNQKFEAVKIKTEKPEGKPDVNLIKIKSEKPDGDDISDLLIPKVEMIEKESATNPFNVPIKKESNMFGDAFSQTLMPHEIVNDLEQSAFTNFLNMQSVPLTQVPSDAANGGIPGPSGGEYMSL